MNLLKIWLLCLFVHTVRAVVFTNENGVAFEYLLNLKHKCRSSAGRIAYFHRMSISECVENCGLRPHCAALNYRKRTEICELFSLADEGDKIDGDCTFIPATNINVKENPCGVCEVGKVCDTNTQTCIIKECGPATDPKNGKVFGNKNDIGAKVKYRCDSANAREFVNAVCLTDGTWSTTVTCPTACGNVSILHGLILQDSVVVSMGSVTCDAGYQTSSSTVNCTSSGIFENATCDPISCGNPLAIDDGSIVLDSGTLFQKTATVTCDPGFQESLGTIRCTASGSWDTVTCDPISCGNLGTIANGIITLDGGTAYQDTATVTCNTGHAGNVNTITCTASGTWEAATCSVITCGGAPSIANGNIVLDSGNTYLSTATVNCDNNLQPSPSTITCTASGTWETATCNSPDCYINDVWDYAGTMNITPTGYPCLDWVDHSSDFRVDVAHMPELSLADAKNYCRQPSPYDWRIWCFTSNPNHSNDYEFCDISQC